MVNRVSSYNPKGGHLATEIEYLDEFEFRQDPTGVSCPWAFEKSMYNVLKPSSSFIFYQIFFILAGKKDNHKDK